MRRALVLMYLMAAFSNAKAQPLPSTAVGAGQTGHAFGTQGTVIGEIQQRDYPIYTGTPTYLDQWVRTLEKSQSGFRFHDESRLYVGPISRVKLDKSKYDPEKGFGVSIRATQGSMRLQTPKVSVPLRSPYASIRTSPGTTIELVIKR